MKKIHYHIGIVASILFLLYSCDSLENEDVVPESFEEISLSRSQFRTVANNKLVFDFLSNDKIGKDATVNIGDPANGKLSSGEFNTYFIYEPASSFIGEDVIPYKVCIGNRCDSSVVVIHVDDPEQVPCPTAIDDFVPTVKNIAIKIPVVENDSICQDRSLTIVDTPKKGTASVHNDSIRYQPATDYIGNDIFKYQVCSGSNCASAMVYVTVFEKDTAKVCDDINFELVDDFYELQLSDSTMNRTTDHYISILSNDTFQCQKDERELKVVEAPVEGVATVLNHTILYTTLQKGAISDKLKYQVCIQIDGIRQCKEAWLNIAIQ